MTFFDTKLNRNCYKLHYLVEDERVNSLMIWDSDQIGDYLQFTSKKYFKIPNDMLAKDAKLLYENYLRKCKIDIPWINKRKIMSKKNKFCDNCGVSNKELKLCSVCQCVYYCSRKCSKIGWNSKHRNVCIAKHTITTAIIPCRSGFNMLLMM